MRKTLVLAVLAATAVQAQFSDVPPGHWAKEAVEALAQKGILQGFPDGTFRGNDPVTRYQMALLLYRTLLLTEGGAKKLTEAAQGKATLRETREALETLGTLTKAANLEEGYKLLLNEIEALLIKVRTLESQLLSIARDLAETRSLQEAQVALEGAQNAELVNLRAELNTLRNLLASLVQREEFRKVVEEIAGAAASLAKEIVALREELGRVREMAEQGADFAKRRERDLSIGSVLASGRVETAPPPLPPRTPSAQGGKVEVEARLPEKASLQAGVGYLEGKAQAGFTFQNGPHALGVETREGGFKASYSGEALEASLWSVGQDRGGELKAEPVKGIRLSLEGQTGASPALAGDRLALGIPSLRRDTPAILGTLSIEGGSLGLKAQGIATPGEAWASIGLRAQAKPLELEASYSQAFRQGTPVPEATPLEPGKRQTSGPSLSLAWRQKDFSVEAAYSGLPEGHAIRAAAAVHGENISVGAEGTYALQRWYKAALNALLRIGPLEAKASFGLAQSLLWVQAFTEAELGASLNGLYLGLGYGEAYQSQTLAGGSGIWTESPWHPALFLGGQPGLSRWGSLVVGPENLPVRLRYELLFQPRPADRFSLEYQLRLP